MTLAKRIVPSILLKGRAAVKGERYEAWRSIGLALQAATVHAKRGVDELLLLDVSATHENRLIDLGLIKELTAGCFVPVTCGGGIRSLHDIDAILRAGGDKVCIGTAAYEVRGLVSDAAARFGSQAIVVSLDVRRGSGIWVRSGNAVCGTVTGSRVHTPVDWAMDYERMGAGEILLSSIDRDGTMTGYDLGLIRAVSQAVSVPVIASGGCRDYGDMLEAFQAGADACAAGALFAFTDMTPKGAAKYLKANGVEVRI